MGGSPSRKKDPGNLTMLCRQHHDAIHLHGWSMKAYGNKWLFFDADGQRVGHSERVWSRGDTAGVGSVVVAADAAIIPADGLTAKEEQDAALDGRGRDSRDFAMGAPVELPHSPVPGTPPLDSLDSEETDGRNANNSFLSAGRADYGPTPAPTPPLDSRTFELSLLSVDNLGYYFEEAMKQSGRAYFEGCHAVAVYRDRAMAAGEKFWAESGIEVFSRSRRTLYSLARQWDVVQSLVQAPALEAHAEEILSLPQDTLRFVAAQDDAEAACEAALALQAEFAEVKPAALAYRLGVENGREPAIYRCPDCGAEHPLREFRA